MPQAKRAETSDPELPPESTAPIESAEQLAPSPTLPRETARRLGFTAISANKDRLLHITHEAPDDTPEYYHSFVRPDLPGYTEAEIEADLAYYERVKAKHEQRQAKQQSESARIYDAQKAHLTEKVIMSDLKKIIPPSFAMEIFPCSDIDDRLNHVDFVVQLEQPGVEPLFFAVDSTYNNDPKKITKKLSASSSPGKEELTGIKRHFSRPWISEFAVRTQIRPDVQDPEYQIHAARSHGFANVKYIKTASGEPLRLKELPKFILGIPESEIPTLERGALNSSGERINTTQRHERLLYELVAQSEQIYRGAYDTLTGSIRHSNGLIDEQFVTKSATEHARRLMNVFMDIDEAHASQATTNPELGRIRSRVRLSTQNAPRTDYHIPSSNAISNTIIEQSETLVAGRRHFLPEYPDDSAVEETSH